MLVEVVEANQDHAVIDVIIDGVPPDVGPDDTGTGGTTGSDDSATDDGAPGGTVGSGGSSTDRRIGRRHSHRWRKHERR